MIFLMIFLERFIHQVVILDLLPHRWREDLLLEGRMDLQVAERRPDDPKLFIVVLGLFKLLEEGLYFLMILSQHLHSLWHGSLLFMKR